MKVHYEDIEMRCRRKSWAKITAKLDEVTCGDCKNSLIFQAHLGTLWRSW